MLPFDQQTNGTSEACQCVGDLCAHHDSGVLCSNKATRTVPVTIIQDRRISEESELRMCEACWRNFGRRPMWYAIIFLVFMKTKGLAKQCICTGNVCRHHAAGVRCKNRAVIVLPVSYIEKKEQRIQETEPDICQECWFNRTRNVAW